MERHLQLTFPEFLTQAAYFPSKTTSIPNFTEIAQPKKGVDVIIE